MGREASGEYAKGYFPWYVSVLLAEVVSALLSKASTRCVQAVSV